MIFKLIIAATVIILVSLGIWKLYDNEQLANVSQPPIKGETVSDQIPSAPFYFEENKGQVDEQVKFLAKSGSTTIFFTPTEIVYQMTLASDRPKRFSPSQLPGETQDEAGNETLRGVIIRQKFVGAVTEEIKGENKLESQVNYFRGSDPSKWLKEIPTFSSIRYVNLYPGIDVVFSGGDRGVEYTFYVSDQANVAQIQQRYEGIDDLELQPDGSLLLHTAIGNMLVPAPKAYELNNPTELKTVSYRTIDGSTVGFDISTDISDGILVITTKD